MSDRLVRHHSESATEFGVRCIKADTWDRAHDYLCDYAQLGCTFHPNPYCREDA